MRNYNFKLFLFSLLALLSAKSFFAQSTSVSTPEDPIVFTVEGKGKKTIVRKSEFERQFLKNLNLNEKKITAKDIDDYFGLYVKFKLKIQDALDAGRDSNASYKQELAGYREQLSRNYLYDRTVTEGLINEAYNRLKKEVKVSHILIFCPRDASEQKVASVLKRMNEIHSALKKNPSAENFANFAKSDSEDPGSKNNGGDLGYLTALQVVYEFENQAYNTKIGEVSDVFRTDFGFHILRVEDVRPNRGDIKVRHILIRVSPEVSNESAKKKIDEIYEKIINHTATFEEMAKTYSEDYDTRYNNGETGWLNSTQFIGNIDKQNWLEQAFKLEKLGDVTQPFKSNYGWHILQKIAVKPLGTFEQMKNVLKNQVQQNQRSQISVDALVDKIKKADGFEFNQEAYDYLLKSLDTNFINGKYTIDNLPAKYVRTTTDVKTKKSQKTEFDFHKMELFKFAGESYSIDDFASKIMDGKKKNSTSIKDVCDIKLNSWIKDICVSYQNAHLEEKSQEFRDIYQEYREGILMFNRMQEKVWDRANNDSIGLLNYYKQHQNDYRWDNRFYVEVYYTSNAKLAKQVMKEAKKGITADSMKKMHTKVKALDFDYQIGKYQISDSFLFAQKGVIRKLFETAEYQSAKNKLFNLGQYGNSFVVIKIHEYLPACPKLLEETRGPVASRYQEELESNWIKELYSTYTVKVNEPTFESIKANLTSK